MTRMEQAALKLVTATSSVLSQQGNTVCFCVRSNLKNLEQLCHDLELMDVNANHYFH